MVSCGNIPTLPASDWSVVGIYQVGDLLVLPAAQWVAKRVDTRVATGFATMLNSARALFHKQHPESKGDLKGLLLLNGGRSVCESHCVNTLAELGIALQRC